MKNKLIFIPIAAIISILISCVSASAFFASELEYSRPEIDNPLAFLIDTYECDETMEDYIKLHNSSTDKNIEFTIYMHHPEYQEWVIYGTGNLKGAGDTDTIDSDVDDIEDYRYYAIVPLNEKEYEYLFYNRNNDLHINILDI